MRNLRAWPIFQVLLLVLSSASCGFSPVYAPGSETAAALSEISVAAPNSRPSYLLVREMEERLGRPTRAKNLLRYQISVSSEGDVADANRIRLIGVVTYDLAEIGSEKVLFSGEVDSFTGYSADNTFVSAVRQDALKRLMVILADQLFRELIIKFTER